MAHRCSYPQIAAKNHSDRFLSQALNNRDQLASSGKPFVVNLYVAGSSLYTSTAGIFYAGNNGKPSVPLYQYGLMFSGPSAHVGSSVGGVTIEDDSSARMSFHTLGDHSIATINDESSGSRSLWITGTHQQQDIEINTNSPSEIQLDGRPAVAIKINASPKQAIMDTRSAWDHGEGKIIEASSGQRICFNETYACQWYDADSKKWYFTNSSGKIVMSILEDGSINIKGHLNEGKDP